MFFPGVQKCESLQEREKDFSFGLEWTPLKDNSVLTPLLSQSISQPWKAVTSSPGELPLSYGEILPAAYYQVFLTQAGL